MTTTPPIIEALKPYNTYFMADYGLNLPIDSDFGNLQLSWWEIVIRFECINQLIIKLYEEFYVLKKQLEISHMPEADTLFRQKFYTEQIFYWLRKSADEIISIFSIVNHLKKNGSYLLKIKLSSIGEFLDTKNPFDNDLLVHTSTLKTLNEISNGFKHSFINSQIHNYHGSEYPVVFAYILRYNTLSNAPVFHTLDLRQVLIDYNLFLVDAKKILKSKYGA